MEEYLNKIKKYIIEENYSKLEELIKLELNEQGKLKRLCNLNNEEYEFMIKLVTHDKNVYEELEKVRNLKNQKKKIEDLEEIKNNIEETKNSIKKEVETLRASTKTKTKIPVIKQLKEIKQKKSNKEILNFKFERIIQIIEQSKLRQENKNLKQKYFEIENIKETLDILYKRCELKDIPETEKAQQKLEEKYKRIIKTIEKDIYMTQDEYKNQVSIIKGYDKRLVEYTFLKKNNYVTLAIDHLAQENIKKENNNIIIDGQIEYELLVYALISIYKLNNKEISITIIEPEKETEKLKTKKK